MDFTIINYYGIQKSRCGYCKGTKTSKAHGMHAYTMSPQDYQALINRGWRRSGQYCYKPHNSTTCCPSYTIKCDALEFKLSKSHKKILKRMTRFLRDGKKEKSEEVNMSDKGKGDIDIESCCDIQVEPKAPDVPLPQVDFDKVTAENSERNGEARESNERFMRSLPTQSDNGQLATTSQRAVKQQTSSSNNASTNPPCKKAKQMRRERREAKLMAMGIAEMPSDAKKTNNEKTLSDYIADVSPEDKHKLKLKLVYVRDKKEVATTISETYELYKKYQIQIHNDPPDDLDDYLHFLVYTPIKYDKSHDGPPQGYGSFHQQYWLDDKLIAVAVIDILPYCLSSVYFFYDPDYSFLSLGTYASLREIEFVQQLNRVSPALKYYYMGFYIHSCPKMRYKGRLVPSELLCPETYTWHLLTDEIRNKLDEKKYERFNRDLQAKDIDEFTENDLDNVILLSDNKILTYGRYIEITGDEDERELVLEYGTLVGKSCAHRMVYIKA